MTDLAAILVFFSTLLFCALIFAAWVVFPRRWSDIAYVRDRVSMLEAKVSATSSWSRHNSFTRDDLNKACTELGKWRARLTQLKGNPARDFEPGELK